MNTNPGTKRNHQGAKEINAVEDKKAKAHLQKCKGEGELQMT